MLELDENILLLINGSHCPYFDSVMHLISGKVIWAAMYACILAELWRRLRLSWALAVALAVIGLTFFLTDFGCSHLIRPLFPRLRPVSMENPIHEMVNAVEGYRHNSYGFPSCHASNTLGLATLVTLLFRHRLTSCAMFFWAIITCYSRVYLGVHYPGDVLVGGVLGVLFAWAIYSIMMSFKRYKPIQQVQEMPGTQQSAPWLIVIANILTFAAIFIAAIF